MKEDREVRAAITAVLFAMGNDKMGWAVVFLFVPAVGALCVSF